MHGATNLLLTHLFLLLLALSSCYPFFSSSHTHTHAETPDKHDPGEFGDIVDEELVKTGLLIRKVRETQTETERQSGRAAERQSDRETERQSDRETERQRQGDRETGTETETATATATEPETETLVKNGLLILVESKY